jgi:2-desacetyl-2-hydroxyethyl bacteriochlorophyllide A dehydrogenase
MQALICKEPGHFEYTDIKTPELKKGHTLIRIKRIGVCGTDLHAFEGTQPFFKYPRILGHELSAEIIDSDDAPGYNKGDEVTFIPYFSCNTCIACRNGKPNCCVSIAVCGVHVDGGMTEILSVPSTTLLPSNGLALDELALVEPFAVGAHGVRRAAIRKSEYTLVIGAGPIGLGTMEFARIAGGIVIAMDIDNSRLQFCKDKLNISHTINAKDPDVLGQLMAITDDDMPTIVIDATGNLNAINNAFQYMAHGGKYVLVGLQKGNISFSHPEFHKREATLMSSRNATREDFIQVIQSMKNRDIIPATYVTHRLKFNEVKDRFHELSDPSNKTIKAIIEMS